MREPLNQFDLTYFRAIHLGWHSPSLDILFLLLSWIGLGGMQAGCALIFLLWPQTRSYVAPLVVTIAVSGLAVAQTIKTFFPRDRPSNLYFAFPQEAVKFGSFPSGHTTTSFACAMMLTLLVPRHQARWVAPLSFTIAMAVGVSRIYRGVHWPSDVLGGAFAGTASSALIYWVWRLREPAPDAPI